MPNGNFDPRSNDSMITAILNRLDEQDRNSARNQVANHDLMVEIKEQVKKTNGRVSRLETWRNRIAGAIALMAFIITIYAALHR
jgi:hypothetical protein